MLNSTGFLAERTATVPASISEVLNKFSNDNFSCSVFDAASHGVVLLSDRIYVFPVVSVNIFASDEVLTPCVVINSRNGNARVLLWLKNVEVVG